jgi:signal transduction histidine kinase
VQNSEGKFTAIIQEFAGTGIGLALCKKIIINHHGEIYASSKLNEGAAFHVILPVKQVEITEKLR